jgi:protein-disulfide isomerase
MLNFIILLFGRVNIKRQSYLTMKRKHLFQFSRFMICAAWVVLFASIECWSESAAPEEQTCADLLPDFIIGDPNAPVSVIVYSAFTCSHCADFHLNVLNKIQELYLKSGKIKIIMRDYPLDKISFKAALIGRVMKQEQYLSFSKRLYETQDEWIERKDALDFVMKEAKNVGLSDHDINQALNNKMIENKLLDGCVLALKKYKLDATPSIIVNDYVFRYAASLEELKQRIDKCL